MYTCEKLKEEKICGMYPQAMGVQGFWGEMFRNGQVEMQDKGIYKEERSQNKNSWRQANAKRRKSNWITIKN